MPAHLHRACAHSQSEFIVCDSRSPRSTFPFMLDPQPAGRRGPVRLTLLFIAHDLAVVKAVSAVCQ
jgi:hypothetical protein